MIDNIIDLCISEYKKSKIISKNHIRTIYEIFRFEYSFLKWDDIVDLIDELNDNPQLVEVIIVGNRQESRKILFQKYMDIQRRKKQYMEVD